MGLESKNGVGWRAVPECMMYVGSLFALQSFTLLLHFLCLSCCLLVDLNTSGTGVCGWRGLVLTVFSLSVFFFSPVLLGGWVESMFT